MVSLGCIQPWGLVKAIKVGETVWLNHPQHGWPLSLVSRASFGIVIHGVKFISFFCLYQNGDFKFPSRVSICYQFIIVLKIGDHHSVGPVLIHSINSDPHTKIGVKRVKPEGFLARHFRECKDANHGVKMPMKLHEITVLGTGEDIQFDDHIFQMGWFNQKLE